MPANRDPDHPFGRYAEAMGARSPVQRSLEERADEARAPVMRDVALPLLLLVAGAVLEVLLLLWMLKPFEALVMLGIALAAQVVLFAPLLFVTVCAVSRWCDLPLGFLHIVLLKVVALTIGPAAVGDALLAAIVVNMGFEWKAMVAGLGFYSMLCAAPVALLFGTRIPDTMLTLVLLYIPRVLVAFALALIFPEFLP